MSQSSSALPFFAGVGLSAAIFGALFFGGSTSPKKQPPATPPVAAAPSPTPAPAPTLEPAERQRLETALEEAKRSHERDSRSLLQAKQQIAELKRSIAKLPNTPAASAPKKPKTDKPKDNTKELFRFGLGEAETPIFDRAKWTKISGNVAAMSSPLVALVKTMAAGKAPDPAGMMKIQKLNMPLAAFAFQVAAELNIEPNTAFTHPAVSANIVKGLLESLGDPLSNDQLQAVQALGERWESERELANRNFTEESSVLARKIVDVSGKMKFIADLKSQLSPSQALKLFDPLTTGRAGVDLLSPALTFTQRWPVRGIDLTQLRDQALEKLLSLLGKHELRLEDYHLIAEDWVAASPYSAKARAPSSTDLTFPHVDQLQACAQAQVAATEAIIARGALSAEQIAKLRANPAVFMLQRMQAPAQAK